MNNSNKAEEKKRRMSNSPCDIGLSRKFPTKASSGLVSINADQKMIFLDILVFLI